ncbi:hypothetical protein [Gordonia polyisoprenivorans]|nr:hypothetical protein [Gordonia polyisoprenivorans]WCB40281.1 hypothetical protein PHA63_07615 [Gordonia polyisoprenivorans]
MSAHRHHDGRLIAVLDELGIENDQLLDSQQLLQYSSGAQRLAPFV